jgi:lactam utilization protein B
MKLERVAVVLEPEEMLEMETIVQDGDPEAALQFLRRLRVRVQQMQLKNVRP